MPNKFEPRVDVDSDHLQFQIMSFGVQKVFDIYYALIGKSEMSIDEFIQDHLNEYADYKELTYTDLLLEIVAEAKQLENSTDVMHTLFSLMYKVGCEPGEPVPFVRFH